MTTQFAISLAEIEAAQERIASHVVHTPCVLSERLSQELGCEFYLKAENLQHVGAFKARGATNAVFCLSDDEASRGVVTHSSGNHAAALARAAALRGIQAHIVMPENSARSKIQSVRSYGVEPVFCEPTAEAREQTAERIRDQTGATLIHPYDHPQVIAGQGTVGLEILQQVPNVEMVVAPLGGGGLLSGILIATHALRPDVRVYGAEPELADDAFRSLQAGTIQMPSRYDSVADGLRSPLGTRTFPVVQSLVREILLVSEQQIRTSMRKIAESAKLVAEPSGAVSTAAVFQHPQLFQAKVVVAVVSGGNLDFGDCRLGSA
ncbi:MAG: threonine/serine dehydratase [bacterium]|nr:threonine/serine dehydratase [bacterium]